MSSIFLFLIGVVLPLYHREGFVMIGDRCHLFFLTVSVLLAISFITDSIRQQLKGTFQTTSFDGTAIFYGVAVLVSTYFSAYSRDSSLGIFRLAHGNDGTAFISSFLRRHPDYNEEGRDW